MKRIFGIWENENNNCLSKHPEIGELVIDGNKIEFYCRGNKDIFPTIFIGNDGNFHKYKVVARACRDAGIHKTLEFSHNYHVSYVAQQNCDFQKGNKIENITECSFIIPELLNWLNINLAKVYNANEEELLIKELLPQAVVLKETEPYVAIVFESNTINSSMETDRRTTAVVKVQPRIQIKYETPVTIEEIHGDISCLMQFWGLMIGSVSVVDDIRLSIVGQRHKCWVYLNKDFSYNYNSLKIIEKPRTTLKRIGEDIKKYFSSWYSFCCDEKYELIRRIYFFTNNSSIKFTEDILVEYIRILEGYSLRERNDEEIARKLEEAIEKSKKEIKELIFTDDGKARFSSVFDSVPLDWNFNSAHAKDIAKWIATGYIGKISLADRLEKIDREYFDLISTNAPEIENLLGKNPPDENGFNPKKFFKKLASTRNYFSHYKTDNSNILEFVQMTPTINSLKAIIIAILYSKMNMDKETIRKILIWDSELGVQTNYLKKEGESPDDCLFQSSNETKDESSNFSRKLKGFICNLMKHKYGGKN